MKLKPIEEQVVVVMGASSGIGRDTALRFARRGAKGYRIDTVFSQFTGRYCVKRVWARHMWRLMSRLLRKVFSHTVAFLLNHQLLGNRPLQLSNLLLQ